MADLPRHEVEHGALRLLQLQPLLLPLLLRLLHGRHLPLGSRSLHRHRRCRRRLHTGAAVLALSLALGRPPAWGGGRVAGVHRAGAVAVPGAGRPRKRQDRTLQRLAGAVPAPFGRLGWGLGEARDQRRGGRRLAAAAQHRPAARGPPPAQGRWPAVGGLRRRGAGGWLAEPHCRRRRGPYFRWRPRAGLGGLDGGLGVHCRAVVCRAAAGVPKGSDAGKAPGQGRPAGRRAARSARHDGRRGPRGGVCAASGRRRGGASLPAGRLGLPDSRSDSGRCENH
mmetsp:Transcript_83901/g.235820  ORF Transcript_83901/g.235820 Transcript_83901/m.235820 type:complete len:281 (+) Transcript_83901:541-1383(+)